MNVHFDGVGAHAVVPVVELLLELRPAPDDALAFGERGQKRILLGGENDGDAPIDHFARGGRNAQVAADDHGVGPARRAAHEGADARGEFVEVVGFDPIVVGAAVEPHDAVVHRVAGRRDEDRRRIAAGAHLTQNLQTVLPGQAQVQDHDGVGVGVEGEQGGIAVAHPVDGVVFAFETGHNALADHFVIFDQ